MIRNNTQESIRQASTSLLNHSSRSSDADAKNLGKQDFLNLLMAQITHQDPLDPMDSEGMVNQMTSMSSLEQLMTLNKGIDKINDIQGVIAQSNAYSFLGKDITYKGAKLDVLSGQSGGLNFFVDREANQVTAFIKDAQGSAVDRIDLGQRKAGWHDIPWLPVNAAGKVLPDGEYSFSVVAKSELDDEIPTEVSTKGRVNGVHFEDGSPVLQVGSTRVPLSTVIGLSEQSSTTFGNLKPQPLRTDFAPISLKERDKGFTQNSQAASELIDVTNKSIE